MNPTLVGMMRPVITQLSKIRSPQMSCCIRTVQYSTYHLGGLGYAVTYNNEAPITTTAFRSPIYISLLCGSGFILSSITVLVSLSGH
jgi:hypothetical protein